MSRLAGHKIGDRLDFMEPKERRLCLDPSIGRDRDDVRVMGEEQIRAFVRGTAHFELRDCLALEPFDQLRHAIERACAASAA